MHDLIIFDCDGVLVDSERIEARVLAEAATLQGAAIDTDEAVRLFRGWKMSDCIDEIERRSGRRLPENFIADVRRMAARAFETELRPIDGIHEALAGLSFPRCVASNGPMAKMTQTLTLTGLLDHFQGRVFSAYEVGSWKPEPGLFLHAAGAFGAEPARCVVVEDSETGVRAGLAAGMRVIGFANGDDAMARKLGGHGVEVLHRMAELPAHLAAQRAMD